MRKANTYSLQFWLVCTSSLLFFASFNMIIPKLPAFLSQLGGAQYKGMIIFAFTLTAMVSRPFSGKLADNIGRVPVIMIGSIVCLLCSFLYPAMTTIAGFVLLRVVHGFSTGFTPTGQAAYLSDIIPAQRRGEAMGLLGTAGALGMAGGAAVGGLIANAFGFNMMFYTSSVCALLSLLILSRLKESHQHAQRFSVEYLRPTPNDWFEPLVLFPCVIMALCSYAYGATFTLLSDVGHAAGVDNEGFLFMALTLASLTVRLLAGKASDRWGRKPVLRISTIGIVIAMIVIALATDKATLFTGVILYGLAQGTTSPTLLAWATDLSHHEFRGRGIASLYIFMELGIGIGAFLSGWISNYKSISITSSFWVCSVLSLLAFILLIRRGHKLSFAS